MSLVCVDQEKNLNVVVERYKKIANKIKIIEINPTDCIQIFRDLKISAILLFCIFKELKSSILSIKPLFRPILKNLFFL